MITVPPKYAGQAYVSPEQAAEILGIDRSTFYRHVMRYVYSKTITSLKIGQCRRIQLSSLLVWAAQQTEQKV